MKALELADMIERYNAGVMSQAIYEDYLEVSAELRRLAAVETERDQLRAARIAYASEFPPIHDGDDAGLPAVDRIHENIRKLKAELDVRRADRDSLQAELERIKALEPVVWANPYGGFLSDSCMKNHATGLEKQTHTVPLYALRSKT